MGIQYFTDEVCEIPIEIESSNVSLDLITGKPDLGSVFNYLQHEFTTATRISIGIENGRTVARVTALLSDKVTSESLLVVEKRARAVLEEPRVCLDCLHRQHTDRDCRVPERTSQ